MPRRKARRKFPWASLSDEELLKVRLKDLKVTVEGTWLEECLPGSMTSSTSTASGCGRMPGFRASGFAPENTPGIAIPFYLAHPRLMRLEKKMILDVEGGT